MRNRIGLMSLAVGVALGVGVNGAHAEVIDFEDLNKGDQYVDGDVIVSNGVPMTVAGFDGGHIDVQANGDAGGTGNELEFFGGPGGGGSLIFDFDQDLQSLSLDYGSYGGGLNVTVNGETEVIFDFFDLPDTLGGVDITVTGDAAPGGTIGTLSFDGVISSFAVGGQEFVMDNVMYEPVPAPGAAALIIAGGLTTTRRRRRSA